MYEKMFTNPLLCSSLTQEFPTFAIKPEGEHCIESIVSASNDKNKFHSSENLSNNCLTFYSSFNKYPCSSSSSHAVKENIYKNINSLPSYCISETQPKAAISSAVETNKSFEGATQKEVEKDISNAAIPPLYINNAVFPLLGGKEAKVENQQEAQYYYYNNLSYLPSSNVMSTNTLAQNNYANKVQEYSSYSIYPTQLVCNDVARLVGIPFSSSFLVSNNRLLNSSSSIMSLSSSPVLHYNSSSTIPDFINANAIEAPVHFSLNYQNLYSEPSLYSSSLSSECVPTSMISMAASNCNLYKFSSDTYNTYSCSSFSSNSHNLQNPYPTQIIIDKPNYINPQFSTSSFPNHEYYNGHSNVNLSKHPIPSIPLHYPLLQYSSSSSHNSINNTSLPYPPCESEVLKNYADINLLYNSKEEDIGDENGRRNYYSLKLSSIPPPQEVDCDDSDDECIPAVQLSPRKTQSFTETACFDSSSLSKSCTSLSCAYFDEQGKENKKATLKEKQEIKYLAAGIIGKQITQAKLASKILRNHNYSSINDKIIKNKITPNPIQLFHVNRIDGKEFLKLDENATKCLIHTVGLKRISVISLCGKYGVGKSFLASVLVDNNVDNQNGFVVGKGDRPCTDGIWMWAVEESSSHVFIILDFEGLGDVYKPAGHDQKIFSLALLISSIVVYNSKGVIDAEALKGLSLVSEASNHMRHSGMGVGFPSTVEDVYTNKSSRFKKNYCAGPFLLWVLRDFSFTLLDELENIVSASDYLEAILSDSYNIDYHLTKNNYYCNNKKDLDRSSYASNNNIALNHSLIFNASENRCIVQDIKDFFEDRSCMTLTYPFDISDTNSSESPNVYNKVNEMFLLQVSKLRSFVLREAKNRALQGYPLMGVSFCKLLQKYVDAINEGYLPVIHSAWDSMQHEECASLKDVCFSEFMKDLRDGFEKQLPVNRKVLEVECKKLKKNYLVKFESQAIGDPEVISSYKVELKEKLNRYINKALIENDHHAETKLKRLFESLMDQSAVDDKLEKELYDDINILEKDVQLLKQIYEKEALDLDSIKEKILNECVAQVYKKGYESITNNLKSKEVAFERAKQVAEEEKNISLSVKEAAYKQLEDRLKKLESLLKEKEHEIQKLQASRSNLADELSSSNQVTNGDLSLCFDNDVLRAPEEPEETSRENVQTFYRHMNSPYGICKEKEIVNRRASLDVGRVSRKINMQNKAVSDGFRNIYTSDSKINARHHSTNSNKKFNRCNIM